MLSPTAIHLLGSTAIWALKGRHKKWCHFPGKQGLWWSSQNQQGSMRASHKYWLEKWSQKTRGRAWWSLLLWRCCPECKCCDKPFIFAADKLAPFKDPQQNYRCWEPLNFSFLNCGVRNTSTNRVVLGTMWQVPIRHPEMFSLVAYCKSIPSFFPHSPHFLTLLES